jgi:hypothetical protein
MPESSLPAQARPACNTTMGFCPGLRGALAGRFEGGRGFGPRFTVAKIRAHAQSARNAHGGADLALHTKIARRATRMTARGLGAQGAAHLGQELKQAVGGVKAVGVDHSAVL